MKGKNSVLLISSVALILVLLLTGCNGASTPTPTSTATPTSGPTATPTSGPNVTPTPQVIEVDKTIRALNPAGAFIPVQTKGLSPRLDNFTGKTIYVIQGEADPVIMPALAAELPVKFPNAKFEYYQPASSFGPSAADATVQEAADGVVRGIGW